MQMEWLAVRFLSERMLLSSFFGLITDDLRIDLGRCDVCMAKHFLHRTQIRTVLEQVGCESVAQNVRADAFNIDVGVACQLFQELCETLADHHVERVKNKKCTPRNGMLYLDMLNNLERIADHADNLASSVEPDHHDNRLLW